MKNFISFKIQLIQRILFKKHHLYFGILLAFVAGALNAGGFLYIGQYTSHMTGIVSSVADFLILQKFYLALLAFLFVFAFIAGAATTAIVINWSRNNHCRNELFASLLIEMILLLIVGAINLFSLPDQNIKFVVIGILCFVMGLQNAMITKISNARMRTTHITGIATDIGIQIGKLIYRLLSLNEKVVVNYGRLKMHSALMASFCSGGLAGALTFKFFGFFFVIILTVLLIISSLGLCVQKDR